MIDEKESPESADNTNEASTINKQQDKGTKKNHFSEYILSLPVEEKINILNNSSRKVLQLLLTGGKYSVCQISEILKVPSPTSCIRYIRNLGIGVSDFWVKTENSRYKVYFIPDAKGGAE